MTYWFGVAFLWIAGAVYVYMSYKANIERREYERKAQRAVEAVEAVEGWRDMKVDEIVDEFMVSDDHA